MASVARRFLNTGIENGGQNANDRDDHEQFKQSESGVASRSFHGITAN